ncbi:RNA polymerase sigma factor [Paenibacillus nanensis]|uniref:RNA polymerase sigma factor n=1 Tax=Paenibacillus nanensis TaxID=393251 RepID=A0A3A1VSR8_9BACL|nr:RNA polymerase sigma factor [Paenibacillus nanensis]RIX60550.1 RNA polymerase sigma factor [Paenibacillus nanensis]
MHVLSGLPELNWEELQSSLYRYCLALTRSEWEAQDLTQTAWTKTLSRLKKNGHANPEALLLRTAKNAWIDSCRRKAAYHELLEGMLRFDADHSGHARFDLEQMLEALIKRLSPLQRTVFILREAFGYSIAETASGLGTTDGAVKAALHRARQAMGRIRKDLELAETAAPGSRRNKESDEKKEDLLREAAEAFREGRVQELVMLIYEGYRWQNIVYAVGSFQTPTFHKTGHSFTTSSCLMRMAA